MCEGRCRACYVRRVINRAINPLWLALAAACACQLPSEKSPESPSEQKPERVIVERGPLPPEEQAPEPTVPTAPAEAQPVEPGLTTTGAPTRGKLPKAAVDETLKSAQPGIQACYEAGLKTKPDLRGVVNVNFVVAPDGKVAHAEALEGDGMLSDASTVDCILGQIKKLEFPAPSGGRVFLSYPLQLEPPK